MDIIEAQKIIAEAKKERETACLAEINEALKKHNCKIETTLQLSGDTIIKNIKLTANLK